MEFQVKGVVNIYDTVNICVPTETALVSFSIQIPSNSTTGRQQ